MSKKAMSEEPRIPRFFICTGLFDGATVMVTHVGQEDSAGSGHGRAGHFRSGVVDALFRWSLRRGEAARVDLADAAAAVLPATERSDVPFLLKLGRRAA
jgi:hypothetical protein